MPCRIGIVNYGLGNLRSVHKALEHVGASAAVLSSPTEASAVDKLILPGVGAFGDGMTLLHERGWTAAVLDFAAGGRPFLGICLGMQLLFDGSEEDAPAPDQLAPGLSILPGSVVRFCEDQGADRPRLKVPHMGWNTLRWQRDDPLLAGVRRDSAVYFVHSYRVQPVDENAHDGRALTSATAEYGGRFCATIWRDNIWATQFHPEKSQRVGLRILENFARL